MDRKIATLSCLLLLCGTFAIGQSSKKKESGEGERDASSRINVIAYYSGDRQRVNDYPVEKLSHIIFSFCHLSGNRLRVDNAEDTATIRNLVLLRKRNPSLKIMLSLGGWGGCETCSPVFSTDAGRKEFASSVKEVNAWFHTDGIDLDWEYPAISGYPGHQFLPADKQNFTALVKALRDSLGTKNEISFAAGGFGKFLDESIEWDKVTPLVDRINLMSYDLVSGFSKSTGHHTPLFSTSQQKESADNGVNKLIQLGVPPNKIVIGAAFYGRTWTGVEDVNNGLYQPGTFKSFVPYGKFVSTINAENGFKFYYDSTARATHAYNKETKTFATFDDAASLKEKTVYAGKRGLNGIMFWELTLDKPVDGLLDVIYKNR